MRKGRFCLLVENDPDDQETFIDILHQVSSTAGCYAVSDGEEALYALNTVGFKPDYIFTTLAMPHMNGPTFISHLKSTEQYRNIPVIVYSTSISALEREELARLGAHEVELKTTRRALRALLQKYFGPQFSPGSML